MTRIEKQEMMSTQGSPGAARGAPAANKSNTLMVYEQLMQTIWAKLLPTLGLVTVNTIVGRAISRSAVQHPILAHLTITEIGLSFRAFEAHAQDVSDAQIQAGFCELIADLFEILAKLTGNIIIQQLAKDVDLVKNHTGDKQ